MKSPRDIFRSAFLYEASQLRRFPRVLLRVGRLALLASREFGRDQASQWAAALAYHTVLALVPVGIIAFALVNVFEQFFNLDQSVFDLLMKQGLPDAAEKAGQQMRLLIEKARDTSGRMGVIGTVLLVVTGLGLFTTLERAVNRVWKTDELRNPFLRFRAFWFVLTLGPILFGVSLWATAKLRAPDFVAHVEQIGFLVRMVVWFAPLLLTWAAFFMLYIYLPNTRVRPLSALMGSILAGSVWELAKWGFNIYVAHAGSIDRIYGPLGILPLFIFWIYVTWVIVLMGVEVAYCDQNYRALAADVVGRGAEQGATREYAALRLVLEICRRFRTGARPPDVAALGRELVLRTETARRLLDDLEAADLVRRDQGGLYLPAREATRLMVAEVVRAVRGEVGEEGALASLFARGESGRYGVLAETTIGDLLDQAG